MTDLNINIREMRARISNILNKKILNVIMYLHPHYDNSVREITKYYRIGLFFVLKFKIVGEGVLFSPIYKIAFIKHKLIINGIWHFGVTRILFVSAAFHDRELNTQMRLQE